VSVGYGSHYGRKVHLAEFLEMRSSVKLPWKIKNIGQKKSHTKKEKKHWVLS